MRKLTVFNHLTLDGYFTGRKGEMSWAHKSPGDTEWNAFVAGNAKGGGTLLFGRITYQMMASFWPTPQAAQMNSVVTERMNNIPKLVVSRTLKDVSWKNSTLIQGELPTEIRKIKALSGTDITVLGSGSLVSQLAVAGLVDEYQIVLNPLALGGGRTLFGDLAVPLALELTNSRVFGNGSVVLTYRPAA